MALGRRRWIAVGIVGAGLGLLAASGIVLCEATIRVPRRPLRPIEIPGSRRRDVEIRAADGAVLRGWLFVPDRPNGSFVIALHGISDTRMGVLGLARLFAANHYAILTADNRGHGESGGDLVTYGIREADDVHRWVDWLYASEHPRSVFGMGESLGAGVLLQSLAVEHRFSAVIAECPFADFSRVAVDRVAQRIPVPASIGEVLAEPMVWSGFLYARARYAIDFRAASPEAAIATVDTPILLIHGLDDTNIYPVHSRILATSNPSYATLWLVPGAKHTAAFAAAPEEFPRRVLGWFADHSR